LNYGTLKYVCSTGRQMIEHTKKLVEDKFTTINGYEHNAEVNYQFPKILKLKSYQFPYILLI
jgi:hypothetical protein